MQSGRILREAREAEGLGLRQLALETRISTAVLEAMERGWRDRLPEATYLRTMLPLLEDRLGLPDGSLNGALPPQRERREGPGQGTLLQRFTPGSIDVFTTWQGTLLYGVLTLGLIYAVNLQQARLAARGLLSTQPIPPLADDGAADAEDADELLLRTFPELRPLQRAEAGVGTERLRRDTKGKGTGLNAGLLRLQLEAPTRLVLRKADGSLITEAEASGDLTLSVRPPFRLALSNAAAGPVRWNGRALAPAATAGGRSAEGAVEYVYPPAVPQKPSAEPRP
jgi:hypothetical protein